MSFEEHLPFQSLHKLPGMMSLKEVSSLIGRSESWVRRSSKNEGGLPVHCIRGRVLYRRTEVDEWFQSNRQG